MYIQRVRSTAETECLQLQKYPMAVRISRVFVFNFNLFIVDGIEVTEAGTRFGDIDLPVRGQHESVDALSCASYVHFLYYV